MGLESLTTVSDDAKMLCRCVVRPLYY